LYIFEKNLLKMLDKCVIMPNISRRTKGGVNMRKLLAHRGDGREQLLKEHLETVARLCASYMKKIGLEHVGYLAGLVHDGGKIRAVFQDYIRTGDKALRGKINHSFFGAWLIQEMQERTTADKITKQLIACAVCSHHGGLVDIIAPDGESKYESRLHYDGTLEYESCKEIFFCEYASEERIKELFLNASKEVETVFDRVRHMGFFGIAMIQKFLFSALVDADRYDTYCFEADIQPADCTGTDWLSLQKEMERYMAGFDGEGSINALRREISDDCFRFAVRPGGVYELFVPTGGGKTLSSLRYALRHCAVNDELDAKDHIYYMIPYCSILDQNSSEIRKALGVSKEDALVLEHHSNVILEKREQENTDELYQRYELLTERWAEPGVILTTMVQFLDTLFAGGTRAVRRLHQLSHSILIFDEIQAIPVNCIHLFNAAINFLSQVCGTTVILCTATQPQLSKVESVPLTLTEPVHIVPDFSEKFSQFQRTKIIDATTKTGMSYDVASDFAIERMEKTDSILFIVNTKPAAEAMYQRLKECTDGMRVYLLSANLCPCHRRKILDEIKAVKRGEKVICVSTQLIEAGVDLSFGCVIRSLAGLDNIAQAAGRCNRHGEFGTICEVYIVRLSEESLNNLSEIETAQNVTSRLLKQFRDDPEGMGGDLLSPQAIEAYYMHYYYERKEQMGYPSKKGNYTLYSLLSDNKKARDEYINRRKMVPPFASYQAFHTMGEEFQVIDSNTCGIIVPYEGGEELIAKLRSGLDIREKKQLLRRGQEYTVNVYDNTKKALAKKKAIDLIEELQVYVLRQGHYDEETGISAEAELEFLEC
jgi:CRISPR-associated endonuclease/helicase Cas3